jgi:hypothetical protein
MIIEVRGWRVRVMRGTLAAMVRQAADAAEALYTVRLRERRADAGRRGWAGRRTSSKPNARLDRKEKAR